MIPAGLAQTRFSNNSKKQSTEAKLTRDSKHSFRVFTEGESVYVQDFTASKQKWIDSWY